MGARRFGPATARFLQRDNYNRATADLGLALDPLTQNRYALASGNPISFVEWDGHVALADGGGGGASSPTPTSDDDNIIAGIGEGLADLVVGTVGLAAHTVTNLDEVPLGLQALTQNPGGSLQAIGEATGFDDPVGNFWSGVQAAHDMSPRDKARFFTGIVASAVGPKIAKGAWSRVPSGARAAPAVSEPASVPTARYSRPAGATTAAQREAVQGRPCVVCGDVAPRQVADHMNPLVVEHYETGGINLPRMRDVSSVQPMCPRCSAIEGGHLRWYSEFMRDFYGFD